MRHRQKKLQLNRFTSWRKATLISLAKSLIINQSIKTTKIKASAVQPLIEKLITMAKKNTLAAKRQAYKVIGNHNLVSDLFNNVGPRFAKRAGGYTRIINLGFRRGDGAEVVILELTEIKKKKSKTDKKKKETKEDETDSLSNETVKEDKPKTVTKISEKPPVTKKPPKNFLGGIKNIFKKERDSL